MGSVIKSRKPALVFYKDGRITVTSWTMKVLGLEPGDAINLWYDGEVYLYGIKNPKGNYKAILRGNNKASVHTCRCFSVELCRYVLDKMGGEKCQVAGGKVKDIAVGKGLELILRNIC